jgi:predicted RNA binding protein YcfA (HicA-like mRNA interferase family)
MKPLPARSVAAALTRKGFVKRENDHTHYHFRHAGKDVGVATMISHGEKEIGVGLIKRMRAQLRLATNADFVRFVECPLTHEKYVGILKDQNIIPKGED